MRGQLLRPPSVVVSDHDLGPEGGDMSFITLDEIDAAYNQSQNMRRRLSDCSTCSSLSFSDSDFMLNSDMLQPEDEEEPDGSKKVRNQLTHAFMHSSPKELTRQTIGAKGNNAKRGNPRMIGISYAMIAKSVL